MARRGLCSRREADAWIRAGKVKVNGEVVDLQQSLFPEDISIDVGSLEKQQKAMVTVALHKPIGYVSSQPTNNQLTAAQLLTEENYWRFPTEKPSVVPRFLPKLSVVGRLDKDSRGLLVFSQDGRFVKEIIGENTETEKEYFVTVHGNVLSPPLVNRLRKGIWLDGKPLKEAQITKEGPNLLRFVLREGRNKQIRRMCASVGLHVDDLHRIRISSIPLSPLEEGTWRFL